MGGLVRRVPCPGALGLPCICRVQVCRPAASSPEYLEVFPFAAELPDPPAKDLLCNWHDLCGPTYERLFRAAVPSRSLCHRLGGDWLCNVISVSAGGLAAAARLEFSAAATFSRELGEN